MASDDCAEHEELSRELVRVRRELRVEAAPDEPRARLLERGEPPERADELGPDLEVSIRPARLRCGAVAAAVGERDHREVGMMGVQPHAEALGRSGRACAVQYRSARWHDGINALASGADKS